MVESPRLEYQDSAQLFLDFHVGAIGHGHFSVLEPQGDGVLRDLERFPTHTVPILPKYVIILGEALANKSIPLAFGRRFPLVRTPPRTQGRRITQTNFTGPFRLDG